MCASSPFANSVTTTESSDDGGIEEYATPYYGPIVGLFDDFETGLSAVEDAVDMTRLPPNTHPKRDCHQTVSVLRKIFREFLPREWWTRIISMLSDVERERPSVTFCLRHLKLKTTRLIRRSGLRRLAMALYLHCMVPGNGNDLLDCVAYLPHTLHDANLPAVCMGGVYELFVPPSWFGGGRSLYYQTLLAYIRTHRTNTRFTTRLPVPAYHPFTIHVQSLSGKGHGVYIKAE
jgi:hypothetical protein